MNVDGQLVNAEKIRLQDSLLDVGANEQPPGRAAQSKVDYEGPLTIGGDR